MNDADVRDLTEGLGASEEMGNLRADLTKEERRKHLADEQSGIKQQIREVESRNKKGAGKPGEGAAAPPSLDKAETAAKLKDGEKKKKEDKQDARKRAIEELNRTGDKGV